MKVIVSPAARRELVAAALYYEGETRGLGRRFRFAVSNAMQRIGQFPQSGPPARGFESLELRRIRVVRFPFVVIYRRADDHIEVVAISHMHRKPDYWQR